MSDLKNKDGGPAFPINMDEFGIQPGISVRDYFACAALTGVINMASACAIEAAKNGVEGNLLLDAHKWVKAAYEVSDAMLKERNKPCA